MIYLSHPSAHFIKEMGGDCLVVEDAKIIRGSDEATACVGGASVADVGQWYGWRLKENPVPL